MTSERLSRLAPGTRWAMFILTAILALNAGAVAFAVIFQTASNQVAMIEFQETLTLVREGDPAGRIAIRVKVVPESAKEIVVMCRMAGDLKPADFELVSPLIARTEKGWQLVIPAFTSSFDLAVKVADDGIIQTTLRQVALQLTGGNRRWRVGTNATHTLTIRDCYRPPHVEFAKSSTTQLREGEKLVLSIESTDALEGRIEVPYTVERAAGDVDISPIARVELTSERPSASIELAARRDSLYEGERRLLIRLNPDPNHRYLLGERSQIELVIEDRDSPPTFSVTAVAQVVEHDRPAKCRLTASVASAAETVIPFTVESPVTNSLPKTGEFRLAAKQLEAEVELPTRKLSWPPGDHQVKLSLGDDVAVATEGHRQTTLLIRNRDYTVKLIASAKELAENSAKGIGVQITLSDGLTALDAIEVTVQGSGTASLDKDYRLDSGGVAATKDTLRGTWDLKLTIPKGANSVSFQIEPKNDTTDEDDKEILMKLTAESIKVAPTSQQARITLVDDDPPPTLRLIAETKNLQEGGKYPTAFAVEIADNRATEKTIRGSLTAETDPKHEEEFRIAPKTFELLPGETRKEFSLEIADNDERGLSPETLQWELVVSLADLKNAEMKKDSNSLKFVIRDDDLYKGDTLFLIAHTMHLQRFIERKGDEPFQTVLRDILKTPGSDAKLIGGRAFLVGQKEPLQLPTAEPIAAANAFDESDVCTVLNAALRMEAAIRKHTGNRQINVLLIYPHSLSTGEDNSKEVLKLPDDSDGIQPRRKVVLIGGSQNKANGRLGELLAQFSQKRPVVTVDDIDDRRLVSVLANLVKQGP